MLFLNLIYATRPLRHTEEQDKLYEKFKITLEYSKSPEHVAFWLEAGIVPSTPTLNFALQNKQPLETIKLLLSRGAKPSAESLALAATSPQCLEITQCLLNAGAKPNNETVSSIIIKKKSYFIPSDAHNKEDIESLRLILRHKVAIEDGILNLAIEENHPPSVIKMLIKAGAEITDQTVGQLIIKRYPPEIIAFVMQEIGKFEVVEIDDDTPEVETPVPFFDEPTLMALSKAAVEHNYPSSIINLFQGLTRPRVHDGAI